LTTSPSGDGGLRTDSDPATVGKAAAAAGVALVELRPAEGAGLEEMFLELTGDTQRDQLSTEGAPA
jgi:ABC-2 type transport system ATP-binding protein